MTLWRIAKYVAVIFWPFVASAIVLYVYLKCRKVKVPTDEEIDKYDCLKHTTCGIETNVERKNENE